MARARSEKVTGEAAVMDFLRARAASEKEQFQALKNRTASTSMAREHVFFDSLDGVLKDVFGKLKLPHAGYAAKKLQKKPMDRIVNLAISDTHFHSMLDPREVPLAYGPQEEARRLGKIITDACEYKSQYRANTECFLHIFGDIIEGCLHDPREAATMTEQFGAATYYLIQAIQALSAAFPKVSVRCVPGNHGRNKQRHKDRATSQKWDSFENMIYQAVKFAVASLPNVTVEIPYTPYYTYKAFDKTGFVTHGDTVIDAGFPSETINIKKIRNQINEWNAGDATYDLFLVGHVHTGSIVHIPSGPVFMSNSCLVPPNGYAVSSGRSHTKCGQWLWESVPGHISGDARFLDVNETHDKDKSFEKVIRPYHGFESTLPLKAA